MIEKVVTRANLLKAYHQVVSNQGSAGVDGMSVKGLEQHLKINREALIAAMREGDYLPQSILGVAIPKSNGKTRLLGIPTGSSPKSNAVNKHYLGEIKTKRLRIDAGTLPKSSSTTQRTAVCENRTYSGVRGALRQ
jgi:retron-type reverse transcriptase